MPVTTTDPITGNDVSNFEEALDIVKGTSTNALKIYYKSVQNKQTCFEFTLESQEAKSVYSYNEIQDKKTIGTIN